MKVKTISTKNAHALEHVNLHQLYRGPHWLHVKESLAAFLNKQRISFPSLPAGRRPGLATLLWYNPPKKQTL